MTSNVGYVANFSSLVTLQLPASPSFGDVVRVAGKGSGGWKITQGAGQIIRFGSLSTTTGTSGFLASEQIYDAAELLCISGGGSAVFSVISSQGNLVVA